MGAGVAGLAAARSLNDAGYSVTLIEARRRIGGRIQTSTVWPDARVDLGASWIHGVRNNPIAEIAREIGARTIVSNGVTSETFAADGSALSPAAAQRLQRLSNEMMRAIRNGQNADSDQSLYATVAQALQLDELSAEDQQFVHYHLNEIEHGFSGSAHDLSTYWFDDGGQFGGNEVVFPNGYVEIADHLARGLGIELGHRVRRIEVVPQGVTISSDRGTFRGSRAVVTLPLGVLKAGGVEFSPDLPRPMQRALDTLQMGTLNKVYLRFPRSFWPNVEWLTQVPREYGRWTNWLNVQRVVGQPILMGFNSANFAVQTESWAAADVAAAGLAQLREIFGTGVPEPSSHQVTRWSSDPNSWGSYSFLPTGSHPSMRDALAGTLEDRVFFAGEATSRRHPSTVHGAYLSGLEAADALDRSLSSRGVASWVPSWWKGDLA